MKLSEFDFYLPPELIAQQPLPTRYHSRLLYVNPQALSPFLDQQFSDLTDHLKPGDVLAFNNSKVIKARLYAHKPSGGKIEILIERLLSPYQARCHVRSNKPLKNGQVLILSDQSTAIITGRHANLFELDFSTDLPLLERLNAIGHIPLPPYIDRADSTMDIERYQTVYAQTEGSVAAPTAGLHFDQALLARLSALGIEQAFVTLHVGAGTFAPVKTENILDHTMHSEYAQIDADSCARILAAKARGNRIIAVGTTSLRVLESASRSGTLQPMDADTQIFIYPGFHFHCVDALITNFHLPQSTLLMLISAFCGTELIRQAYTHAIAQQYRFFSYGDACFLECC